MPRRAPRSGREKAGAPSRSRGPRRGLESRGRARSRASCDPHEAEHREELEDVLRPEAEAGLPAARRGGRFVREAPVVERIRVEKALAVRVDLDGEELRPRRVVPDPALLADPGAAHTRAVSEAELD